MENEYRYFITLGATEIEITPANQSEITYDLSPPVDTCIGFRLVMNGDLLITDGYQFDWISAVNVSNERLTEIKLRVERLASGAYSTYYNAFFICDDCEFDNSLRTISIKSNPDDEYRQVLENYDQEINLLSAPLPGTDAKIEYTQFYTENNDVIGLDSNWFDMTVVPIEGVPYKNMGDLQSEDTTITETIYISEVSPFFDTEEMPKKYANWPKIDNFGAVSQARREPLAYFKIEDFKILTVAEAPSFPDYTLVYDFGTHGLYWRQYQSLTGSVIQNSRKLTDVLKYTLDQIAPTVSPSTSSDVSLFYSADTNYVSSFGTAANRYKDTRINQITDVKFLEASNESTSSIFVLKDFLEANKHRFFWFINKQGKFQYEHYQYRNTSTTTFDTTVPDYEIWTTWKNKYSYNKESRPKSEAWTASYGGRSAHRGNFRGVKFEYTDNTVNKENDGIEYSNSDFTYDLNGVWTESTNYDNNIYVIYAVDENQFIYRSNTSTNPFAPKILNTPFSFEELSLGDGVTAGINVFRYSGYTGINILVQDFGTDIESPPSGTASTIVNSRPNLDQEPLEIPYSRDISIDYLSLFETELGDSGLLRSAVIDPTKGTLTLDISFPEERPVSAPIYPVQVPCTTDSSINECTPDGSQIGIITESGFILLFEGSSPSIIQKE